MTTTTYPRGSQAIRCHAADCPNVLLVMATPADGRVYVCASHRLAWGLTRRRPDLPADRFDPERLPR